VKPNITIILVKHIQRQKINKKISLQKFKKQTNQDWC